VVGSHLLQQASHSIAPHVPNLGTGYCRTRRDFLKIVALMLTYLIVDYSWGRNYPSVLSLYIAAY
jgi:hypothetical protein